MVRNILAVTNVNPIKSLVRNLSEWLAIVEVLRNAVSFFKSKEKIILC